MLDKASSLQIMAVQVRCIVRYMTDNAADGVARNPGGIAAGDKAVAETIEIHDFTAPAADVQRIKEFAEGGAEYAAPAVVAEAA